MNKEKTMTDDNRFDQDMINEFGGEENADALDVLIGAVTEGVPEEMLPPEPEVAPQEVPPEEVILEGEAPITEGEIPPEVLPEEINPEVPPQPQMSPETQAILSQMQEQNNNIAAMQEQIKTQPQVQPEVKELTEEEQALEELKERMGFNEMTKQNEILKQQLDQQKQEINSQEAKAYQSAIRSDIDSLKIEFTGFDESLVAKELDALSNQPVFLPNGQIARDEAGNPVNHAMLNDNKAGWAKIWQDKFATAKAPTPDPIVPASAAPTAPSKTPMERIKETDDNITRGQALLDIIGG